MVCFQNFMASFHCPETLPESEGLEELQQNSFLSDELQLSPGSVLVFECLVSVHMPVAACLFSNA
jgi:hypothetical protein